MSITGLAGPGAGARRHPHRRPVRRQLRGHGRVHRAARARGVGRGAVGADLAAAGADRHARLPGRALDGGGRGAGPGRQRSSDWHPDRRVPDQRRPHQHRRVGPAHLQAPVRGAGRREPARGPGLRHRREALGEPQAPQCRARRVHRAATAAPSWSRSSTRPACPPGRSIRVDQMFADPQVQHVGMAVPMPHPTRGQVAVVNQAVALSRTPSVIDRPDARARRAHRRGAGRARLQRDAIADLRSRKAI